MSLWEYRIELLPDEVGSVDEMLAETASLHWNIVEQAVEKRAVLVGFFDDVESGKAAWQKLQPLLPERLSGIEPEVRRVEEREWQEAYKAHFHAWHFGDLHWAPLWERETFSLPEGHQAIWLDPGMAFGTGNHETTRLCAERLVAYRDECIRDGRDPASLTVIDAGCGSGILALSAVKCGFGDIVGFDNDPVAIDISRENAELNDCAQKVSFFESELASGLAGRAADLLIANIQADVLAGFAGELTTAVKPGGVLVLSGILSREGDTVRERFEQARPSIGNSRYDLGEWCALEFRY